STRGCHLENAVRIRATNASVPFVLSCPSALDLALWERHIVQPTGRDYFAANVKQLEHFGSYACRNIYGRKDAPLSRHATADAVDVAGFVLSNGRPTAVRRDWGSDDADGRFLRDVHDGACRIYDDRQALSAGEFITLAKKVGLSALRVKNQQSEDDIFNYLKNRGPICSSGYWPVGGEGHVIVSTGI